MPSVSRSSPTARFTGLADLYARCRPGYPEAALDHIITHCGLHGGSLLVDVGCGTGISARLFARRGIQVIGIEPNADMRLHAEVEAIPWGLPMPIYQPGRAEATGLADGKADAVLAAQAFHWFDVPAALREFHRILKPGGWVVLLWNERDESDPFTAAYGAVIRSAPDAAIIEGPRAKAGEALLQSPLFQQTEKVRFAHEQTLDQQGVLGRAFSASYAPREPKAAEGFAQALREVFARFQVTGKVVLRYQTSIFYGQRPPA
jgi:SAM-dependent methyltransferase